MQKRSLHLVSIDVGRFDARAEYLGWSLHVGLIHSFCSMKVVSSWLPSTSSVRISSSYNRLNTADRLFEKSISTCFTPGILLLAGDADWVKTMVGADPLKGQNR